MNTKPKKKLLLNIIVGGIFFLLLLVCSIIDLSNPLGFFSRTESVTGNLNKIISMVILTLVLVFLISLIVSTIISLLKNVSENTILKVTDIQNTLNIVPIILLIFIFIDAFFFSPVRVSGYSMENTLNDGDLLVVSHLYKEIDHGDIVLIKKDDGDFIIKRVVAKEGDTLMVDENSKVYVNGEIIEQSNGWRSGSRKEYSERVLEKGEYFVLGDNRNSSSDSRVYGIFNEEQIIGKVMMSLSPWSFKINQNITYK